MNNPKSYVQEATVSDSICLNHLLVVAINVTATKIGVGPFGR